MTIAEVAPASAASVQFMISATVRPFRPDLLPPLVRPQSFNDDLNLGSFRPSRHVWSGEQRRGIATHVTDAVAIADHVMKSLDMDFFLAKDIPLPEEISAAMTFMLSTPLSLQADFWKDQLARVKQVVEQAKDIQAKWYQQVDPSIISATGKCNFIAMMSLMGQFNLGGKAWLQQFVWGFPIVGDLIQAGVYPTDPETKPAPGPASIWNEAETRYQTRARGSGWPNADHLWGEALDQVKKGVAIGPPTNQRKRAVP